MKLFSRGHSMFSEKQKNEITGVVVCYPNYKETSHADARIVLSEEFVAMEDLAKEITISSDLDSFVPVVSNRAESASMSSSKSLDVDTTRFCNCKVKAIKRTVKKNSENKRREFWGCGKHFSNPEKCDYFSWATARQI